MNERRPVFYRGTLQEQLERERLALLAQMLYEGGHSPASVRAELRQQRKDAKAAADRWHPRGRA